MNKVVKMGELTQRELSYNIKSVLGINGDIWRGTKGML